MKGALEAVAAQILGEEDKGGTFWIRSSHSEKKSEILEPRSVLYQRRSPSPPTSTSTLSSSFSSGGGGGGGGSSENPFQKKEEWAMSGIEGENQEQTFLRWIMGDINDPLAVSKHHHYQASPVEFDAGSSFDPLLGFDGKNAIFMNQPTIGMNFFQQPIEEKPQIFPPNLFLQTNTHSNPDLFLPSASFGAVTEQQQTSNQYSIFQDLIDQLFKAAECVETGNFISAHGILARLNQHLSSPFGKPFLRSAFYFKEALLFLVANSYNPSHHHITPFSTSLLTPLDVVLKLSAYKAFSEVSPVLHFTNFTITQVLLEELGNTDCIHVIDFDIGIGGQWSSFIHELSLKRPSCSTPRLRISAFVSLCAFHPLELHLISENLSLFASERNIPFEINISGIESFDPVEILAVSTGCNETIAVNLPVGAGLYPSFTETLHFIKQLSPKIVLSVDQGSDRSDLPFSHHFLHAFQSSMILLDSIDAAGCNLDTANKIERFILQPKIENCVIGRYRATDKLLQWRSLFASAGFVPVQFSNFTEVQADCILKRVQVRGFHVEKRQTSLYLYWQRGELVSISAWRC